MGIILPYKGCPTVTIDPKPRISKTGSFIVKAKLHTDDERVTGGSYTWHYPDTWFGTAHGDSLVIDSVSSYASRNVYVTYTALNDTQINASGVVHFNFASAYRVTMVI